MVIFFEWHRTTMDQRSSSGLPMTGEDTGLGVLASPMLGYLGKVQERAGSLDYCPWCASKGSTYALRSYRINLHESITLCTNPQCLFPLVSRSLEDILASLEPVEPTVGNKRKNALALENEELIKPAHKRLRSSELDCLGPRRITDSLASQAEQDAVNIVSNGQHAAPRTDGENVNGYHWDSSVAKTTECKSLQDADDILDKEPENGACADGSAPPTCSALAGNHKPPTEGITTCKDTGGIKSETENLSSTKITMSEELVPVPNQLFWRNSNNLCWLDSLLVALVNCKSLTKNIPKDEPQQSPVWQLMKGYEDICAAIQVHQQTGSDDVVRVSNHVLEKANADLNSLQMSVFKLLQPKLQCKLGEKESPVFAIPLLLMMDSWVEPLFQSTFHWEFKCSECKTATRERVTKTLPTFTNILPDWRPLRAVHLAPCNVCCKKNQRRTMMLESVPPVFGLHFVEGLPDNDIRIYAFDFKGKRYSVTTVIQYNHQLKHFVTWICNSDGSWREYDDLKHQHCKTHQKLPVPAQEMHVVFWEVEADKELPPCSPSSTFAESPLSKNERNPSLDRDVIAEKLSACTPDQSLVLSHNDTDIICALSASVDSSNIMDTTVTADVSIGSTTLLDTFEGLSHNDIITLTLVELKADSETQPLNDSSQTQDLSVPSRNEILDSTPDSSSAVTDSEMKMSHSPDAELPITSNSSESEDGSSSDPTFVPGARRGQRGVRGTGRGKPGSRQAGKRAASSKEAPHISPPAPSKPSKVISKKVVGAAAQDNPPPVEMTQRVSPVSSTNTSPKSTSERSPTMPPKLDQNARWSFLLSKHPLHQVNSSIAKLPSTPATQLVKCTPPAHSTPNPVRRQQTPGGLLPKPLLKTEESGGLPLKAAEMYGAFGAKSSNTPNPPPSTAPLGGKSKLFPPTTSNHLKSLTNTTVVSVTSHPIPGAKALPEVSSSKKHSSQSSKTPPGLSETDALRYKLIKKLKAKKKKLAKLNQMLGQQGGANLRPDSTDLGSPNTVTSSTYDGSVCDDFLSDLLSPATTASNLSPDSTGFLEMLANGQDGGDQLDGGVGAAGAASQMKTCVNEPNNENFLDDFLSQAVAQRPTEMEAEALSALELFI
ncbi:SUMO-specific isopeptidase USPL1 [Pempheris klunzingeri]|uniref:SUMO-specific isopeptidase USPL1 n=1 Tax=Pempheris klunzingeri TaxID=3127111 RepID=UPI00397EBAE5